jgi:hypothetical protein
VDDDLGEDIEKFKPATLDAVQPFLNLGVLQQKIYHKVSGFPEKVDTGNKQQQVNDAGYDDPFPQAVLRNEAMRLHIRLYSNDNFFQHNRWLKLQNECLKYSIQCIAMQV